MNIVFDLDGTLIDSLPDIHATANTVLERHGTAPLTLDEARSFVGRGLPDFVQRAGRARDLPAEALPRIEAEIAELYMVAHDLTVVFPGVIDALTQFAAQGHNMAVCTNKLIAPTRMLLDQFDLARFFRAVVGGDSLPLRKPDPAPLRHAIAQLPAGPACLVGDSAVDAATAQAAAVPFLLFTEGYRAEPVEALPHHAVFSDFADLPGLIQTLGQ